MKNWKLLMAVICAAIIGLGNPVQAQDYKKEKDKTRMVGGAEMSPERDIVENASKSSAHTTLVQAVQAANLVETLKSEGPFTVFAPTNAAFGALPPGTLQNLLDPMNRESLQNILTYHVLSGEFTSGEIVEAIKKGGGTATFKAVNGEELKAVMDGKNVRLMDKSGTSATVTTADVKQSNGVIHVVNTVLLPSG